MNKLSWDQVEQALASVESVTGGFTDAHRGIITIANSRYFVKKAKDDRTHKWIEREINMYEFLSSTDYMHIPQLVAVAPDKSGFCLEALESTHGWDWSNSYSHERVESILSALADLKDVGTPRALQSPLFQLPHMSKHSHGWSHIFTDEELQARISNWLTEHDHSELAEAVVDSQMLHSDFENFEFRHDTLTHMDIRGDNCAWNAELSQTKIIDWNWSDIGDYDIDRAAFLTNVEISGLDITKYCEDIRPAAFLWLAGFWLEVMVNDRPGKQIELKLLQMQAAVQAYRIYTTIR